MPQRYYTTTWKTVGKELGRHWYTWHHIGYVLLHSSSLAVPCAVCMWWECSRRSLSLSSRNVHQMSVRQRYPDGEMEGFAMRYSGEREDDHCSTHAQKKRLEPVKDAYLIVGTNPSDHMRFVQHSRVTMCDKSSDSEPEVRVTSKSATMSKRYRKANKEKDGPHAHLTAFNWFVKDKSRTRTQGEKVMSLC